MLIRILIEDVCIGMQWISMRCIVMCVCVWGVMCKTIFFLLPDDVTLGCVSVTPYLWVNKEGFVGG